MYRNFVRVEFEEHSRAPSCSVDSPLTMCDSPGSQALLRALKGQFCNVVVVFVSLALILWSFDFSFHFHFPPSPLEVLDRLRLRTYLDPSASLPRYLRSLSRTCRKSTGTASGAQMACSTLHLNHIHMRHLCLVHGASTAWLCQERSIVLTRGDVSLHSRQPLLRVASAGNFKLAKKSPSLVLAFLF